MDWIAETRRAVELEMLEKALSRLRIGPPESTVEFMLHGKPLLRMTQAAAQQQLLAEYSEGARHQLRTREEVLAFLAKHGIPYELLDDPERNARVDREAHRRLTEAALNRRKHMHRRATVGRAFL